MRPSLVRGQPALEAVSAGGLGARCDALLREGSEHTALFALRPCADLPAQSLGTVVASWSRAPLEPGAEPSTDGGAEGSGTEPAAALAPERSARLASPAAAALPLPPREALPFAPPASSTEAALPAVAVEPVEFDLALTVPSEGRLGALLQLQLSITNRTDALHTFRLSFSENEAFLFSGFKLQQFQLPPGFGHTAKFNLVPILSGPAQLPPLRLLCTRPATVCRAASRAKPPLRPARECPQAPRPMQSCSTQRRAALSLWPRVASSATRELYFHQYSDVMERCDACVKHLIGFQIYRAPLDLETDVYRVRYAKNTSRPNI